MIIDFLTSGLPFAYMISLIVAFALAVLVALVMHEWAHAFAALKCGDPSAKIAGRLSLNPARHVEPFGLLCFCLAGIGWAKPVPVNPFNYRNFKRGNFFVSVAGVLMNFVIGFFCSLFMVMMLKFVGESAILNNALLYGVYHFFYLATVVNISLMIFNLLPVYPLDGYNVLVSFTKPNNKYMQFMRQYSMPMLLCVLLVMMFTGGISYLRDGVIYGFEAFWGLIF